MQASVKTDIGKGILDMEQDLYDRAKKTVKKVHV